jgi:hypothetical protein
MRQRHTFGVIAGMVFVALLLVLTGTIPYASALGTCSSSSPCTFSPPYLGRGTATATYSYTCPLGGGWANVGTTKSTSIIYMDAGVYCDLQTGGPYVGTLEAGNTLYAASFTAGGSSTFVASRWIYSGYYYSKLDCSGMNTASTKLETDLTLDLFDSTTGVWSLTSPAVQTNYSSTYTCLILGAGVWPIPDTISAQWATMGYTFSTTSGNVYDVWAGFYVDPNISMPSGAGPNGEGVCSTMDNSSLCNGASGINWGAYLDNGTIK